MPDTVPDEDTIRAAARGLGSAAFTVKDWVKSRKHEWATAGHAATLDALPGTVREFERLQGPYLTGEVVIREFVELDRTRPEYRVWWTRSGTAHTVTVHPDDDVEHTAPPADLEAWLETTLAPLVRAFGCPFVTTDIAHRIDGSPVLIEVGDGQVSGLPRDHLASLGDEAYPDLVTSALRTP